MPRAGTHHVIRIQFFWKATYFVESHGYEDLCVANTSGPPRIASGRHWDVHLLQMWAWLG